MSTTAKAGAAFSTCCRPSATDLGGRHLEAARLHGARQPLQERLVVLHDQQRALGLGDLVRRMSIIARLDLLRSNSR